MKIILTVLLLSFSSFAQKVTDSANMLGNNRATLEEKLKDLPVWIETWTAAPGPDLKAYADSKIKSYGQDRSFIIVVTTQPRGWRISMNPTGFVGGEATRTVGDRMAGLFKRGDFYNAFLNAGQDLSYLASEKAAPAPAKPESDEPKKSSLMWWVIGGCAGMVSIVLITYLALRPKKTKPIHEPKKEAVKKELPKITPTEKLKAQRVYEKYSPTERRTIVNNYITSPYYHTGIWDDPFQFYLFMHMVDAPQRHDPEPARQSAAYSAPEPTRYVLDPTPASYSRSDDSGSSGSSWSSSDSGSSYDSGSSSSDSSSSSSDSSSDSGGSGGSW
ncbi:MAG: TPM domain-containing protein [Pseudomonadota bacterium]